jgi:hypothetical protein
VIAWSYAQRLKGLTIMKLAIGIGVFIWLICGVAGAWRLEGLGDMHWQVIARGPISLVKAFRENPVTYPGPD